MTCGGPLSERLCCKSLFAPLIANFSSCRRGFRVNMWGTSSPGDERIGDFGNEPDATSISDRGLFRLLAGNLSPGVFRLLQHNPSKNGPTANIAVRHRSEPDFYVRRILRTPFSSAPPCQFGSLAGLEHGQIIPFSDIGLSTGAFVLGNPQIRCRQHCRFRGPQPRRIVPNPLTMRLPSRLNATLQTSSSCGWAKTHR
jgi:hypothetical protein